MCNASPISAGPSQHQYCFLCSAISTGAKSLIPLRLLYQNSPKNWVELTGNRNKLKTRWRLTLKIKHCPAPWSEAHTHRLTPVSTHLSFHWTLPLITEYSPIRKNLLRQFKYAHMCTIHITFTLCTICIKHICIL